MDFDVLIAGGGPVGATLALALRGSGLATRLVEPAPRTTDILRPIALSHASRLILERVDAFDAAAATPIETVHVSQAGGFGRTLIRREDLGLPALGYVFDLARLAQGLAERSAAEREVARVAAWQTHDGPTREAIRVTLANETVEREVTARLLVLADGGQGAGNDLALRDYGQTAIVAAIRTEAAPQGRAWERFTPDGPLALLPLGDRYALVWTVRSTDAAALLASSDDAFLARLAGAFGARLGRFVETGPRASYPLQLRFRRDNIAGARTVIIGNAAQTLHPVAGQGLNLGLRDAFELAELARRTPREEIGAAEFLAAFRNRRGGDRRATIDATDSLVRLFSNDQPLLRAARGIGLAALDLLPPARRMLARRMIFGLRGLP